MNTRFLFISRSTYYNQLFHPISSSCAICHSPLLYQPIFIPITESLALWIISSFPFLTVSQIVSSNSYLFTLKSAQQLRQILVDLQKNYLLYSSWCIERLAKLYIILNQLFINQIRYTRCCFLSFSLWFITDIHW